MEITTIIGCKNFCSYCPQDKFIKAYLTKSNIKQMSFEVFKECVDKIPIYMDICFSGMCEPWLNPECSKMLLYAHARGFRISVFTTLVGMSLSDIDLLESIPFRSFRVHLPSSTEYEKIEVDDNYLALLHRLTKTNIQAIYHVHYGEVHTKIKSLLKDRNIELASLCTRAGNIKIQNVHLPQMQSGIIGCKKILYGNVLLPNGDVLLCCMDYGMQHVLGNLLSSDHESLFLSTEFLKIQKGLRDESIDILCRYCVPDRYNVNPIALLLYGCQRLKSIHGLKDFLRFGQKAILELHYMSHH